MIENTSADNAEAGGSPRENQSPRQEPGPETTHEQQAPDRQALLAETSETGKPRSEGKQSLRAVGGRATPAQHFHTSVVQTGKPYRELLGVSPVSLHVCLGHHTRCLLQLQRIFPRNHTQSITSTHCSKTACCSTVISGLSHGTI